MRRMLRSPTTPGESLVQECLKPLGLTQWQLADHLGCDVKVIHRIANGRSSVTAEMAVRLAAALDTTPEFWLNAQTAVDLHEAVRRMTESIVESRVALLSGVGIGTSHLGTGETSNRVEGVLRHKERCLSVALEWTNHVLNPAISCLLHWNPDFLSLAPEFGGMDP